MESTYRRYADGHQIYAFVKLQELIDRGVLDKYLDWLNIRQSDGPREQWRQTTEDGRRQARADATDNWPKPELISRYAPGVNGNEPKGRPASSTVAGPEEDWPDPLPLAGDMPAVESLAADMLPTSFRALAADIADRMQVPIDYPGAAMVVTLAGAVNRRAAIQPKARDSGWIVTPNLWGAVVGRPGYKKSPVLEAITGPLRAIQTEWFLKHEAATAEHERAREVHALKINAWKQLATAALKEGKRVPDRPPDSAADPECKRLIVTDATAEALHKVLSKNPAGVLVLRDELTGWLTQLDKSGRECERAFCLEAWNGTSGFTMDRVERGIVHAEYVCMSLLGGIQPGRLRSYLTDALADGPGDDGLIQRFQVMVWPDLPSGWELVDRKPDSEAERTAGQVLRRLVNLPASTPPMLFRFAPDAQELFNEWYGELQLRLRGGTLHEALAAHLSKYASLMPSLALLFEMADQAARGAEDASFNRIVELSTHDRGPYGVTTSRATPGESIRAWSRRNYAPRPNSVEDFAGGKSGRTECWLSAISTEGTGAISTRRSWPAWP